MKKKNRKFALFFDRLLSESIGKQMLILAGIIVVLFVVSFTLLYLTGDDWIEYCDKKHISHWVFTLYLLIDGNAFNDLYTNDEVFISKLTLSISGITFVAGVLLFTGAFISILTNVISQRVERHNNGLIPYLKSGHYVIMGYDDMVTAIIRDIFNKDPQAYVLLMTAVDAKTIHEKLRKTFDDKQLEHIIINYGLRTSKEFSQDIRLEYAEEVFIVGYRALPVHDAMNVENIDSICSYLKDDVKSGLKPKRITCVFEDMDTYASFKTTEIFKHVGDLDIEFIPYNFYSGWANQVLLKQQYKEKSRPKEVFDYPTVYGDGIKDSDERFVHLVFVGITNLSSAFAMEAAHLMHFPNYDGAPNRPKTRITFIDLGADKDRPEFITRNRHLFEIQAHYYRDLTDKAYSTPISDPSYFMEKKESNFLDVEFEFIKGDIFSQKVQNEISHWSTKDDRYLTIFLTMANQKKNFMMGMNMPDEVYDHEIPIFIRQDKSDNFVTNLRTAEKVNFDKKKTKHYTYNEKGVKGVDYHGRYAKIYPFGMSDMAFYADEVSIKRAKLINFLYATADYDNHHFQDTTVLASMTPDRIWEKANEEWKKLTVALKWSNLYCAYHITFKLASLRAMRGLQPNDLSQDQQPLTPEEISKLARVEHNRWNIEKLLMGYRKAGHNEDSYAYRNAYESDADFNKADANNLEKNKKIYIHHDLRPFDELDKGTQQWDYEIAKYIPWILKMTQS